MTYFEMDFGYVERLLRDLFGRDPKWSSATCGDCAWAIDTTKNYPFCRQFHLDIMCDHPACPAFVRRKT